MYDGRYYLVTLNATYDKTVSRTSEVCTYSEPTKSALKIFIDRLRLNKEAWEAHNHNQYPIPCAFI